MTPALDARAGPDTEAPLEQMSDAQGFEPLACVSCRARKLKCDRTRPACTRCTKVQNDCVYPESRRKPTFKRRNVKELEARLAQVEDYLKEVTHNGEQEGPEPGGSNSSNGTFDFNVQNGQAQQGRMADAPLNNGNAENPASFANSQLLGMGYSESLPPFEIMEELINIYFSTQHPHMPIIHPSRFYQGFYGGALRRPPMCLQYIMWACAAQFHPKYDEYSEVFYQRARQYMDVDEMKGTGEHFITMAHAQAYALLAQFEAKCMYFTRAAMTSAKCVRLVQMMGLDRLDGEQDDLPPALPPATSWVEMEERRRTFWGAFAIDSHACVSTGWPSLIVNADITTRLPASEEAFASGKEQVAPFLDEIFHGATYEGFAGPIVICRIFKGIMHHVHRSKPRDQPEDLLNGAFWKRHRELDNELLSAFMFLPEQFRLPRNIRNPMALHLNLNLHASVICLHHAAVEKAEKFGHTDTLKASIGRLKNAADEIVSIARLTAHNTSIFKNPLSSLSLYCATTVYVYMAKTDIRHGFDAIDKANFETLIQAMEAIARVHQITRAFLQQACLDIERNGLLSVIESPSLGKYRDSFGSSNIPMLARSSVGRHTKVSPVLPGKLPLDKPEGQVRPRNLRLSKANCSVSFADDNKNDGSQVSFNPSLGAVTRNIAIAPTADLNMMYSNKRKRQLDVPGSSGVVDLSGTDMTSFASNTLPNRNTSSNPATTTGDQLVNNVLGSMGMVSHSMLGNNMALPDRTTPSSSASPLPPQTFSVGRAETQSGSSEESPKATTGLGNTVEENRFDFRPFAGRVATPIWPDLTDDFFHNMVQDALNSQNNGESLDFFGDHNWAGGHLPG